MVDPKVKAKEVGKMVGNMKENFSLENLVESVQKYIQMEEKL